MTTQDDMAVAQAQIIEQLLQSKACDLVTATGLADKIMARLRAAGFWLGRWQDISEARKNNSMYLLAVRGGDCAFENLPPAELHQTFGFNAAEDNGDDRWRMAGWCWEHDHIVEGDGEPVKFCPLPPPPEEPVS